MSKRKQKTKKDLLKVFIGYGYHIWVILFLANVLLVYTVQFYLRAAPKDTTTTLQEVALPTDPPTPTDSPTPTPSPTPVGPVLNVSFQIPGIGTQGGNLKPQHPKRNLFLLFYSTEVNAKNSTVKPLHTITSNVTYDADPKSPTYTSFVNKNLDLGTAIPNGPYQVVFKMDQVLSKLIKEKDTAVGGKILSLDTIRPEPLEIPTQTMIVGDIFNPPHGDDIMDGKDHEMLLNCFGTKTATKSCLNKENADLNDDGTVDGTDYNIMLGSFRTLKAMGFPVPSLSAVKPSVPFNSQISKKPSTKPVKKTSPTPVPKSSNATGSVIVVIFILLLLGGGGFFAYKKGLLQKFVNPSPKDPPATPPTEGTEQTVPGEVPPTEGTGETPTETEQTPSPEAIAQSTEIPISEVTTPKNDSTPPADMPVVDTVEREYYVKKGKTDDKNGGVWLTLTDDSGPIDGYYKGTTEVAEGFAKVKGTKKIEGEKTYIEIAEITPEG